MSLSAGSRIGGSSIAPTIESTVAAMIVDTSEGNAPPIKIVLNGDLLAAK